MKELKQIVSKVCQPLNKKMRLRPHFSNADIESFSLKPIYIFYSKLFLTFQIYKNDMDDSSPRFVSPRTEILHVMSCPEIG